MLSSGMFARHQPPAPALRRGRALYVEPRSFPEKSVLCFHTLAHSFIFRIQHFSLQALCFQSIPHSFQKYGGWVSTLPKVELATQHSSRSNSFKFFLFTLLRTLWRNGRNTTLLESIRSALFLSQWGWRGTFSASGRRCGPREAKRRGATQILTLGFR